MRVNGTKSGQQLCSINVLFDQYPVGKKLNKTLIKHNCSPDSVRLILISTSDMYKKGLKTTYSSIVELKQKNCRRKNCQTSLLLREKYANLIAQSIKITDTTIKYSILGSLGQILSTQTFE